MHPIKFKAIIYFDTIKNDVLNAFAGITCTHSAFLFKTFPKPKRLLLNKNIETIPLKLHF